MAPKTKVASKTNYVISLTDNLPDIEVRQNLMARHVLTQSSGRSAQRQAKVDEEEFDWDTFKEDFKADLEEISDEKVYSILAVKFGLRSIDAIRKEYNQLNARFYGN